MHPLLSANPIGRTLGYGLLHLSSLSPFSPFSVLETLLDGCLRAAPSYCPGRGLAAVRGWPLHLPTKRSASAPSSQTRSSASRSANCSTTRASILRPDIADTTGLPTRG